jgi:hypothetical protein
VYTTKNFKSLAELKRAIKAGERITIYQPGPFGSNGLPLDGTVSLEGPHYPKAHSWYARATLRDGLVVKIS